VTHPLEPRLAAYIATRMPAASDIAVDALERISAARRGNVSLPTALR
jgi:hypothetical protein